MTCVPEIHSMSWKEKVDKRNILKSLRLSIYLVLGSPLLTLLLTDVCQINFLMLDFLLQLKSIYIILALAYKKSLFLLSLKYLRTVFMSSLRLPLVQDNPSSFLLGHIFLYIAFLLHSQSFLKLDAVLQGWAEQEGCFTCLIGVIFVCTHQCHICLFNNSLILLTHVQFVIHIIPNFLSLSLQWFFVPYLNKLSFSPTWIYSTCSYQIWPHFSRRPL